MAIYCQMNGENKPIFELLKQGGKCSVSLIMLDPCNRETLPFCSEEPILSHHCTFYFPSRRKILRVDFFHTKCSFVSFSLSLSLSLPSSFWRLVYCFGNPTADYVLIWGNGERKLNLSTRMNLNGHRIRGKVGCDINE